MGLPNGFSATQVARCISSKRLQLTILPTEKCNFRCTYCYEDFAIGRMKAPTIEGIKNLVSARKDLQELSLSWFGGEPLLALGVIREISAHCISLSRELGFAFDGGLTTNGYLLKPDVLEELVSLNQNFFQITLDGWGDVHDQTRRRADGKGTFKQIWRNLLSAAETDLEFEILLRIHLTNSNFESLRELCREIRLAFRGDNRFRLDFQDVRDLGGEGGESVVPLGAHEFKQRVAELLVLSRDAEEPGSDSPTAASPAELTSPSGTSAPSGQDTSAAELNFDIATLDQKSGESAGGRRAYELARNEPYICYASKPNHFLIRADGRVGKCTVALDHPGNTIGAINADGTISLDVDSANRWHVGFQSFDLDQMGCPLPFVVKQMKQEDETRRIEAVVV